MTTNEKEKEIEAEKKNKNAKQTIKHTRKYIYQILIPLCKYGKLNKDTDKNKVPIRLHMHKFCSYLCKIHKQQLKY